VKYIALLLIFSYQSDGLDHKYSTRIAGYTDRVACERHLASMVAQVTQDPTVEVEQQVCFEGYR
jgi:hypothetical protein